ncbi:MAG TPA: alkaline phosphatase family protein [Solirubrobacteraceae bacterium]|nr:alkaline phosphatase family protein [Solirubrobacteraceae bacterium]
MAAPELTRRDLLKAGAALGGTAAAYGALGGNWLGSAAAQTTGACRPGLQDIEHVVILMQENRPFDQFFGTFPGVRGFADPANRQAFFQPGYRGRGSRQGRLIPFRFDGHKPIGQCIGSIEKPNHDWIPQHRSWNQGRNDRFYQVHTQWDGNQAQNVMGYYTQSDIPYFWALAREYTLCDMYFSSVIGPTESNRLYSVSATLDPDGRHGGPCLATHFNAFYGLSGPGPKYFGRPWAYHWTTMPEQLEARGITWKSYTQPLELRDPGPKLILSGNLDSPFSAFRQFRTGRLNQFGIQPTFPNDFLQDLDRRQLPAVSWIQVNFNYSEHPNFAPAQGEYAVDQVLRAIWAHPDIWRKTVVIINHDENGGFFDHVAPPTAPRGTKGEWLTVKRLPVQAGGIRGPIGLGFRVPCIIVSPWTRGGLVCSDTFDHTSVLRLIERRFGAEVPNLSKWRRSVAGDLTPAFNFRAAPDYSVPKLPPTSLSSPRVNSSLCDFHGETGGSPYPLPARIPFPRQQPGRPRRPSGSC